MLSKSVRRANWRPDYRSSGISGARKRAARQSRAGPLFLFGLRPGRFETKPLYTMSTKSEFTGISEPLGPEADNATDSRQPVRHEVVTYVLDTIRYLCLRVGQSFNWRALEEKVRTACSRFSQSGAR